jgi:hypothetical protein
VACNTTYLFTTSSVTSLQEATESALQPHHCATIKIHISYSIGRVSFAFNFKTCWTHCEGINAPLSTGLDFPLARPRRRRFTLLTLQLKLIWNSSYTNLIPSRVDAAYALLQFLVAISLLKNYKINTSNDSDPVVFSKKLYHSLKARR